MSADLRAELEAIQKRATSPWNVADIGEMRTRDVPRLVAALEAVLPIHKPDGPTVEVADCLECGWESGWPCPTVQAINAALTTKEAP